MAARAKPFMFICGDDDFLVVDRGKAAFAEMAEQLEADDMNREVIDGRAGNVAEVEETITRFVGAVQTLSLFGGAKAVWLKDVSFLADSVTGRAQGTLAQLDRLQAALAGIDPASVGVLITASPVDRRRSFFKWLQKHGATTDIKAKDGGDDALFALARTEVEAQGCTITHDALEVLVSKLHGNARLIQGEANKLATYVTAEEPAGGEITETLVNDLVSAFGDADFFEAAEVFYTGDLRETLAAIDRHFFSIKDARGLISSLQNRNRLMIQLRVLMDGGAIQVGRRGVSKSDLDRAARSYGDLFAGADAKSGYNVFSQNPWYLGRLAQAAGRFPLKKLIDFQMAFIGAFESIIRRPNEQPDVMKEVAVSCLG
ncbi:MAG: DNA polymerase III subunit delta [Opitutales bacterium]